MRDHGSAATGSCGERSGLWRDRVKLLREAAHKSREDAMAVGANAVHGGPRVPSTWRTHRHLIFARGLQSDRRRV
jgi:hypothetical protein